MVGCAPRSRQTGRVLVELKNTPLPPEIPRTVPVPWTPAQMDGLDAEIRSVFPRHRIVAPDDIRDGRTTLEAAVLRGRWPTLAPARGKVLFLMDKRPDGHEPGPDPRPGRARVRRPHARGR